MFTGIITDIGEVKLVEAGDKSNNYTIATKFPVQDIKLGASICCSGVCLTVAEKGEGWFKANASKETLDKTTVKLWKQGKKINLERSLKIGDELGGHIVFGHVDGVGEIISIENVGDSKLIKIFTPPEYNKFIVQKGSMAIDGVSLTINNVKENVAEINVIPHTSEQTTFKYNKVGEFVNLEIDMLARFVAKQLEK